MRLTFLLIAMTSAVLAQPSERTREFNLFEVGVFRPGMTEAEARGALEKLHRKYEFEKDARTKSSIWITKWIEDKRQILDGRVDLGLRFEGKDLFKNDRILVALWLVWKDWCGSEDKSDDKKAGVGVANDQLTKLFGRATGKQVDSGWPFWKFKGGDLQLYPLSCVTAEFNMRGELPE